MYSPADIESKQFVTTRLREGYEQNEVDAFLDGVAGDYREFTRQLGELSNDNHRLQSQLKAATMEPLTQKLPVVQATSPSIASIEKLLVVAQQTADQTTAEANHDAGTLRADARREADQMLTDARAQAESLLADATAKAEAVRAESERSVQEASNKVVALQEKESYYKTWLKNALTSFEREFTNG